MANQQPEIIDGSSIVEMDIMDDDRSDYEVDLSAPSGHIGEDTMKRGHLGDSDDDTPDMMEATKTQVATGVASFVWEEGRQRARKAFSVYGNIDILRPYFDVEPRTVRNRLIHSLIPKLASGKQEKVPRELYGPTMVVFTLVALLLFQMKVSGHTVQEGTLMGSAIGVCFTYWLGVSSFLWFLSYVCNTHLAMLQILSLVGYALFGHCVALFLGTTIHSNHSHLLFYVLWIIFGGLSTLRMVAIFMQQTAGRTQRMIVCGAIAGLHMLFLLYLHFTYHEMVEELSITMGDSPVNPKIAPILADE